MALRFHDPLLREDAIVVYDDVFDLLRQYPDDVQHRNRRAIELHGKLDKLTGRLEVYNGLDKAEISSWVNSATKEILIGVFKIDPDKIIRTKKEAHVAPSIKPGTRVLVTIQESYANDDVAGVTLTAHVGHEAVEVTGTAKRAEGDKPNQAIGLTLAHGRALRKLGNQLIVEANEAVKAADAERRREKAKVDQERAKSTKAERKVRAERTATILLADVHKELKYLRQTADEQRENADELHRLVEELQAENEQLKTIAKKKDYEARIATRRANQAAKPKASAKKVSAKR